MTTATHQQHHQIPLLKLHHTMMEKLYPLEN
jgi:hypothetical protein